MNDLKKAFDAINTIVADWDPLGVGETIAEDEYTGYIPSIMQVIENGESLFEYLSHILINDLGSRFDPTDMKHVEGLESICDRIIGTYTEISLL